jgi:hypothetical protein
VNALQCYVIRTVSVLFSFIVRDISVIGRLLLYRVECYGGSAASSLNFGTWFVKNVLLELKKVTL